MRKVMDFMYLRKLLDYVLKGVDYKKFIFTYYPCFFR